MERHAERLTFPFRKPTSLAAVLLETLLEQPDLEVTPIRLPTDDQ